MSPGDKSAPPTDVKVRQKCGDAHVFGTSFCPTRVQLTSPLWLSSVRLKEMSRNCRIRMVIEREVALSQCAASPRFSETAKSGGIASCCIMKNHSDDELVSLLMF